MVSALISRVVILVFGTLYPAYASYKAVKTKNIKEYVKWMMYWIVYAFFITAETFADVFVAWIPFYYEIKILFVLWLLSPATKGASVVYRKFIHPQLAKREKDIDAYINTASDKGYTALLSLGTKGLNMATNAVITTAIKGQSSLAHHIRKSYSLNDLSDDSPENQPLDRGPENDDEIDNRILEEQYQQEMQMKEEEQARKRGRPAKNQDDEKRKHRDELSNQNRARIN